jgi:hypothetical protein
VFSEQSSSGGMLRYALVTQGISHTSLKACMHKCMYVYIGPSYLAIILCSLIKYFSRNRIKILRKL